ncbi:MAG: RluA family pseudouridine synthase [Alphaproteobacteria bacterium]|nr:RluA family pseudouridine synthase [Alphaproteobacteria bacterium]
MQVGHLEILAGSEDAGERLDKFLARAAPDFTRVRIKALILAGHLSAGGATIIDPSGRVKSGQMYQLRCPPPTAARATPEAIPLVIVHEDAHLIVVDKPAGLVVHPAPGNRSGTLVNALMAHCAGELAGIGGVERPGIVHRLDKDTSGLIVAAKTDHAHQSLVRQFAARTIDRTYTAVVWGVLRPSSGMIEGAIGRSHHDRKRMAVVRHGGKAALTRYTVIRDLGGVASVVACRLETGRTHQIRVHLAAKGHPLVGDPLYGRRRATKLPESTRTVVANFRRQALHAGVLGFHHPVGGQAVRFESPVPDDMVRLIAALGSPEQHD